MQTACREIAKTPSVDEIERADELVELFGLMGIIWVLEITDEDMKTQQADDESIYVATNWPMNEYQPLPDELRLYPLETRTLFALLAELQLQEVILVRLVSSKTQLVVSITLRKVFMPVLCRSAFVPTRLWPN